MANTAPTDCFFSPKITLVCSDLNKAWKPNCRQNTSGTLQQGTSSLKSLLLPTGRTQLHLKLKWGNSRIPAQKWYPGQGQATMKTGKEAGDPPAPPCWGIRQERARTRL